LDASRRFEGDERKGKGKDALVIWMSREVKDDCIGREVCKLGMPFQGLNEQSFPTSELQPGHRYHLIRQSTISDVSR
jgi:hypothetical protein